MADCKQCLHYEVCADMAEKFIDAFNRGEELPVVCKNFKDRSRYVVREKGEWRRVYEEGEGWVDICTRCKAKCDETDFCPNCGADMRKEKHDEDG